MASKGQKFKSYSPELKEIILKEYFDGVGTPRTLSLKYDVPFKTIKNWITKTKHNIDVKVDHRAGNSGKHKTLSKRGLHASVSSLLVSVTDLIMALSALPRFVTSFAMSVAFFATLSVAK